VIDVAIIRCGVFDCKDAAQAFVAIYFLITRGWPSSLRYTTTAFISEIVFRERLIFFL
jgi:hypothetical protein